MIENEEQEINLINNQMNENNINNNSDERNLKIQESKNLSNLNNNEAEFERKESSSNFDANLSRKASQRSQRNIENDEDQVILSVISPQEALEFREKSLYANFSNFKPLITEDLNSIIKPKRTQLIKTIITKKRRDFEAPTSFNDKSPGEEGPISSTDIKQVKTNDYPMLDQAYMDIGLQTNNDFTNKSYQVPKVRTVNKFSQVEPNLHDLSDKFIAKANFYLNNSNKIVEIEKFLQKVRPRMEASLQSNETIDIFLNDFDLDRNAMHYFLDSNLNSIKADDGKQNNDKVEFRTFRDNQLSGLKTKKEKSINYIRIVCNNHCYIAHSIIRNLTFEERVKVIGIPYQSQIVFWNFKDIEVNSPVYMLENPMEVTCFEFCPSNVNLLVCGLFSGQLLIYEINDLLNILIKSNDSEFLNLQKKSIYIF